MRRQFLTQAELKDERVVSVTGLELARLIALILVMLALTNAAAWWVLARWSPNLGYVVLKTKWNTLLTTHSRVDWLVLGDSSANQGVNPSVLAARLGGTALNLATIADAAVVNDAWMLQEYITRHGAPRAVLLVHVYDVWHRDLLHPLVAEVPLPWGYWQHLEPRLDLSPRQSLQIAALRYVPLYARQDSLLMLMRGWADPSSQPRITPSGYMEVNESNPRLVDEDTAEHLAFTRDRQFVMSDDNRRALEDIGRLADQYGFEVFLVTSPLYEGLYAQPAFRGYFDQMTNALQRWAAGNPHRHAIFQQPMLFPREMLQNVDHLTGQGAVRYSDELAIRVEQQIGARSARAGDASVRLRTAARLH